MRMMNQEWEWWITNENDEIRMRMMNKEWKWWIKNKNGE